ncbi:hypothetical protein [Halobaculum litoreum]|uniref:hypothetical protein n=1 Tax=Halobaculum litoreum TaxID=3031998 RepID=UPI0024C25EFB|nr:hypothetical protein [Halobaculum sp. DT92]
MVSEDLPSNADWRRVTIHDSGRTYTGRTVTFPQDSGRLAMLDGSWKLNATTHEERTRRITRIEKSDPDGSGDEWTLVERDVHTETQVYYEDRYEWYDSKFDRAGWTYTGQVRTDRVVIGDGHDHDRQKHRRTTRSCSNWDLDVGPFGGFSKKCDEWDYDTETWYTGHDHDGRTYYDTEYQYKTEVERTKTVTYHKYAGEETRTVTLKTFAETEPWVEWLWEKDSGEVEERYALEEPRSGSYIAGTLRVVEVRCGSEESHHDEVMC